MNIMKAIRLIFLICIANNTFAEKINLDRIIAIVGDGIIMESQLLEAKKHISEILKLPIQINLYLQKHFLKSKF